MSETKDFTWHCQRMGGSDLVTLETITELRHLRELDPRLWGAMSCPSVGLEYSKRMVEYLDEDRDGRIRIPEILNAVDWLCARINDSADIKNSPAAMPLSAIDTEKEEGRRIYTTAKTLLAHFGKPEAEEISEADVQKAVAGATDRTYNGDGVLPAEDLGDAEVTDFVTKGLAVVGGTEDASGKPGLNKALGAAFMAELATWKAWQQSIDAAPHALGTDTAKAWDAMNGIKAKINDYFLRCQLTAFAPQARTPLNAEERLLAAASADSLDTIALDSLPLSQVDADAALDLAHGINPVWSERLKAFAALIRPLLADAGRMTFAEWKDVQAALAPYGDALAARPAVKTYDDGAFAPAADAAAALDAMGRAGVEAILSGNVYERFVAQCDKDLDGATDTNDIAEIERLVVYYTHLHRLLMNFVSFHGFYSLRNDAIFRAGTLYMDGRSCQLCLPVADIKAHSALVASSELCLLYCECTRRVSNGAAAEKRTIMAALTAGSDDVLVEGRNGVFVDNTGADWDATLVKIVRNPISIQQAVWAPYKRISQLIGEQVTKFASSKSLEALNAAKKTATDASKPGVPFDISKSVGIFAAVGIALGAIGTAVGSIANALFSLAWWQFPLLIVGIFATISGPNALLAMLKFRKRNLAPVLEASGWAVNTAIPINLKLGSALTQLAQKPDNLERPSLLDPFKEEERSYTGLWCALGAIVAVIALGGWLWWSGHLTTMVKSFMPQTAVEETVKADKKDAKDAKADKKSDAKDEKKDAPADKKDEAPAPAPAKDEKPAEK